MGKESVVTKYGESILWKDTLPGAIVKGGGTSKEFNTGEWRVNSPEYLSENCRQCLLCIPICPDSSIPVENGKRKDFDFEHCKGCGICAKVCPFSAIKMNLGGVI